MPAKDYNLAVTPLTNTVWICKQSKKDPHIMTNDRVAVDKSHFIGIVLEWALNQMEDNENTVSITIDGKEAATIKLDREALGLTKSEPAAQECDATNPK